MPKLQYILYILYPIQVYQQLAEVLINLGDEINTMNPNFAKKLGFQVCKTKVGAKKIDGSKWDTFGMVIVSYSIEDKERRSYSFEEIFLLTDISMDIAPSISFFTLNNIKWILWIVISIRKHTLLSRYL